MVLAKKKEYQTYIAIATETAKCNISTLSTKPRRGSSATCRWLRDGMGVGECAGSVVLGLGIGTGAEVAD
jgi:hypothetical protein